VQQKDHLRLMDNDSAPGWRLRDALDYQQPNRWHHTGDHRRHIK
jgi:hypothetical protein